MSEISPPKIIVCIPGNTATGGPEALHQLADALKKQGVNSGVLYYPFEKNWPKPAVYSRYDVDILQYPEGVERGAVLVFPEVATRYMRFFPNNYSYVWWLSLDNYFGKKYINKSSFWKYNHAWRCLKGRRRSLRRLKKENGHLAQSEYVRAYMAQKGIKTLMLSDYLGSDHTQEYRQSTERKNIILYNPSKGTQTTQKILKAFPDLEFVPLVNLRPDEVRALFCSSRLYMDFGFHPGKDRMPREAVMAGCCLITGMQGSAANGIDVAIPRKYKIDERSPDFLTRWKDLVIRIFDDFPAAILDFEPYREKISEEQAIFDEQVRAFVRHAQEWNVLA